MSRIRGMLKTALVMKALQVAQRELSKPENQRKIQEGLSKVRDRVNKPRELPIHLPPHQSRARRLRSVVGATSSCALNSGELRACRGPRQPSRRPEPVAEHVHRSRDKHRTDQQRVEQHTKPTMMPISVGTITGSTPRTVNTAASRMPALVMTPPVTARA